MPANESVEQFRRLVRERYQRLRESLGEFVRLVVHEDQAAKVQAARNVMSNIGELKSILVAKDHPAWVAPLENIVSWYIKNAKHPEAGRELFKQLVALEPQIAAEAWEFDTLGGRAIDFGEVYDRYLAESRVEELFDRLVGLLQEVIDSGEVDSVKALRALENLAATLKRNSRGNIVTAVGALQFANAYLRNFVFALLEEHPHLKPFTKAFRDTIEELGIEMSDVQAKAVGELQSLAAESLPVAAPYAPRALPSSPDDPDAS